MYKNFEINKSYGNFISVAFYKNDEDFLSFNKKWETQLSETYIAIDVGLYTER